MTYATPELLLVGAAQSLVLDDDVSEKSCRVDFPQSELPELW
jgi:hypothetical protein